MTHSPRTLYEILAAETLRYLDKAKSDLAGEVFSCPPSQFDRVGHVLFTNLKVGGYCTLVVTGRHAWNPRSLYYETCRLAAKRGCKIDRAFLLPHRHCRHDPTLQEQLRLDQSAGIATHILYIGDLISTLVLPYAESLEFALWDDCVACMAVYGQPEATGVPAEWRLSRRDEDTQPIAETIDVLRTRATSLSDVGELHSLDLEEPMVTTAPIARTLAPVLCLGDHVAPNDCSWYHGIWQYLRIFNMVSTPTWHASFYAGALAELAQAGNFSKILISGTADYSVLAHILWAFKKESSEVHPTVLDLCETPLLLCKWYAKLAGVPIRTVSEDLLSSVDLGKFDAIVTDAFLTRFSPGDRVRVVERWRDLLRIGGRVVTTIRVDAVVCDVIRANPAQADAFRRRALREAQQWRGFIGISPEQLANEAQRYAERMVSCPVASEAEIRALFMGAGFSLIKLELIDVPGELIATTYAELVAERSA